MWRIGHVCIHSGPAEESYCPRVHRQHRGRGRRNRSRSMLSMKLLDPLPFTPFCRAFVAAQFQVVSDWAEHSLFLSARARWKCCWKQWRGRRKQKLKWRSRLEGRHQKIWRPIEMSGEQMKKDVLCSYEWVCRAFVAVLASFEMLWRSVTIW